MTLDGKYIAQYILDNNTTIVKVVADYCDRENVSAADHYAEMFLTWIFPINGSYAVGEAHNVAMTFFNKHHPVLTEKYLRMALNFDPDYARAIPPLIFLKISSGAAEAGVTLDVEEAAKLWGRLNEIFTNKIIAANGEDGSSITDVIEEIKAVKQLHGNVLEGIRQLYLNNGVDLTDYDLPIVGWFS